MPKKTRRTKDNILSDLDAGMTVDPDQYNLIAKCARLLGIQLIESNFSISPAFFASDSEKLPNLDISELHEAFDEESRVVTCVYQLEVSERRSRKKVYSFKNKFVIFYHIDYECDAFHATAFARRTGLMAVYPYFRAHLSHVSSLANADIPVLPTVASMPVKSNGKANGND